MVWSFEHDKINQGHFKRYAAGVDVTFYNVDPRDVLAERYKLELMEGGQVALVTCPLVPFDVLHNQDAINAADGSSEEIVDDQQVAWNQLSKDESRHNSTFFLDFRGCCFLKERIPAVFVDFQRVHSHTVRDEVVDWDLVGVKTLCHKTKRVGETCKLKFRLALVEEHARIIREGAAPQKQSKSTHDKVAEVMNKLKGTKIY